MLSSAYLLSGGTPTRPIELRAGPLTLRFEPDTAFLRHIRLGDHEVVRAFYAAVRHHDWATIPPRVTLTEQDIRKDSFRLAFDVQCVRGPVDYSWKGVMTGEASGRIRFDFDGIANSDFRRNRIGICVLHPIEECRGKKIAIGHTDGTTEQGTFPDHISPHQPFFDIRSLQYDILDTGVSARLEFSGDTFEMEDQRNWSDASYKTYCTPLARPMPHPVSKGDRVQQSVALRLEGNIRPIPAVNLERSPQLSIPGTPAVTLPPLGLCVASHGKTLSARELERLKALKLSHLRVDIRLGDPAYPKLLERAWNEARAIGAGLHVALELGEQRRLVDFFQHLERIRPRVALWILLHESENPISERMVQQAAASLQSYDAAVPFAAGTRDFFTEVNRTRPEPGTSSFLCYSNTPQVHAFDDTTLVENLAGQVYNVESARQFTKKPVTISPITLRIRANSQAERETAGALSELPPDVDPRQLSLFGAGWTLGSIARLTGTAFVDSLTYFETTGWRGLMETEAGPLMARQFPSEPGAVFPMYHLFADLAEFGARRAHVLKSSHPLLATGINLAHPETQRLRLLVANLGAERLQVNVEVPTGVGLATVRYLDETTAEQAMRRPEEFRQWPGEKMDFQSGALKLELRPFALARVDIG